MNFNILEQSISMFHTPNCFSKAMPPHNVLSLLWSTSFPHWLHSHMDFMHLSKSKWNTNELFRSQILIWILYSSATARFTVYLLRRLISFGYKRCDNIRLHNLPILICKSEKTNLEFGETWSIVVVNVDAGGHSCLMR